MPLIKIVNEVAPALPAPGPAVPPGGEDPSLRLQQQLNDAQTQLSSTQHQLLQNERLAGIGQLAAGMAHEINNPVGYVHSNISTLERYVGDLFRMLAAYEAAEVHLAGTPVAAELAALREELELEYLKTDIPELMAETVEGITRVRKIVKDLKDFSRVDDKAEFVMADLRQGLESTLTIVHHELKYKAEVVREYGDIPDVECLPSELNQVFLNLLINASHAIDKSRGRITVRTGRQGDEVWAEVEDDGCGIAPEHLKRIFDPFFTTKPVGKGTGLGLALAYGTLQKHHGRIDVRSTVGQGTCFRLVLPVRQPTVA